MEINDLHCDLLFFLEKDVTRSSDDPLSQCSIPQMKKGGIRFQALANFNETKKGSSKSGERQNSLFKELLKKRANELHLFDSHSKGQEGIGVALAIENASGLIEENEDLSLLFQRMDRIQDEIGSLLYISLTWNSENRFGGGNATKKGLKKDGESFLNYLDQKNIAIDLSHTSDWLAADILQWIDKKGLKIQPLASHSNFRKVKDVPRNLPDELAKEIIHRKGVIGVNLVRSFIGEKPTDLVKHIEQAVLLGGEENLCFGADFFAEIDSPPELNYLKPMFFPGFDNSSCYPELLQMLLQHFPEKFLRKIANQNLENFLEKKPFSS